VPSRSRLPTPRKKRDAVEPSKIDSRPVVREKEALRFVSARIPMLETTAHAIAVFGDRAKALDWLKTPTHLFGGKSPEQHAGGGKADEVDKILTRIEYGVFS
jgi:uncharacterized protein (DUF2384 family)